MAHFFFFFLKKKTFEKLFLNSLVRNFADANLSFQQWRQEH